MATTAALTRLRASAARVFLRYGETVSFQKYSKTKDWEQGSESWSASGSPVSASMAEMVETKTKTDSNNASRVVRSVETVYHVEITPFLSVGGLDEHWRVTVDGAERSIKSAIMSEDETFYIVRLGTGARP